MAVYWDKKVPIPKVNGITINRGDGNRVLFVKEAPYDAKVGYTKPKRNTIGYICDDDVKLMHPTGGFKTLFPTLWETYFHEKVPPMFKRIGMYTMADAINGKTGIKDIMDSCFEKTNADAMMDFTLYSMLFQTSVAEHFGTRMSDQLLFSGECYSDSFFSDLLKEKITRNQIETFKKAWALQCKEDGIEEAWAFIDGSNDDCESTGVELAEKGHAKSLRNRKIVAFTHVVSEKGKPVTFDVYRGGLVDQRALKRLLSFLHECGIKLRGVVLDRGYCDATSLRYLSSLSIPYVVMVKGSPKGFSELLEKYRSKIRFNAEYLVRGTFLFGVQEKVQLFKNYEHEDYLTLFHDFRNGADTAAVYLKKLYQEMDRVEALLEKGEKPVIDSMFRDVLKVSDDKIHTDTIPSELQKVLDEKGMYSIVTSEQMSPADVYRIYKARTCSEIQYKIIKTQLGYGTVRVHITNSVHSKFTIGFIASCMRYELQGPAESMGLTTSEAIQEMNMISMSKIGDSYVPLQGLHGKQLCLLIMLDASEELLNQIAKDENDRLAGRRPTPRHRKTGPKKKKGDKKKDQSKQTDKKPKVREEHQKKKPGVKAGTKRPPINKNGTPRKKPGVPAGYKRGSVNKDGSPRKKPGPKPKNSSLINENAI